MASNGYVVMFEGNTCTICDSRNGVQLIKITKTRNNMFLLDISTLGRANVAMNFHETSSLWHIRFGHLNFKSLKLLADRDIVKGMPKVAELKNCEDCIAGKNARLPF